MNATLPQRVIDRAIEADPEAASAEYGAEFRGDLEVFVGREAIEALRLEWRHGASAITGRPLFRLRGSFGRIERLHDDVCGPSRGREARARLHRRTKGSIFSRLQL